MANSTKLTMADLLAGQSVPTLMSGDVVEGSVISSDKHEVWLDLGVFGTGVVVGRELEQSHTTIKPGDAVSASVLEPETADGYVVLSLKKVAKEKGWDSLEDRFGSQETFGIVPYDANKGGLLVEVDGIRGFLPVSQLSAENYPRVSGADKDEILNRLHQLVGRTLMVRILDLDRRANKLIVSEKAAQKEFTEGKLSELQVGDEVEGIVTGVVDFGIFVNVDGIEGLVHISEISWDRVDNPGKFVHIGQKVKARIISIDQDKLSLSIKQLSEDPWAREIKQFKIGDTVEGKVTRITPFGAFVQVSPVIEALVHVSELADEHVEDPASLVKLGESKKFSIIAIEPAQHKLSLSLKTGKPAPKTTTKKAAPKAAEQKAEAAEKSTKK